MDDVSIYIRGKNVSGLAQVLAGRLVPSPFRRLSTINCV